MFWSIIQECIFWAFLLFTIYFVIKRKYVDLLALSFLAIGLSCFKYAITIWTPEKIVNLGMVWCVLFHNGKRTNTAYKKLYKLFVVMVFLILYSDFVGFLTPPKYGEHIGATKRIVIQTFAYITPVIILLYGSLLPKGFTGQLYRKYCHYTEIGLLIGFVHYIFTRIGIPFMPIQRLVGGTSGEEVLATMGSDVVMRIYGLAGEPKGLGFLIVPYIVIQFVCLFKDNVIQWRKIVLLCIAFFVLFHTYSSSALLNLFFILPVVFWVVRTCIPAKTKMRLLFFLMLFGGLYCYDNLTGKNNISEYIDNLYGRTFERGQAELENDRQEAVIFDSYTKEPLGRQLAGWGMGQYTFQAPNQYIENSIVPVQSGLVLTLVDFGCLGFCIWGYILFLIIKIIKITRRADMLTFPYPLAFAMASASKLVESFMHGNIVTCLFFLMIAYYMFYDCKFCNWGLNEKRHNNILV